MASTLTNLPADAPLHVGALSIVGTSATRESFLNHVVAGVFDASTSADVLEQVKQAANKLQRHDIFEEIKVYMTASGADAVNVTFDLKEKGKGVLETTLGVGENEANVNGTIALRNIFGGAETAYARYAFGNRTKAAIEIAAGLPVFGCPDAKLEAFGKGAIRDYSPVNYYVQSSRTAGLRFKTCSPFGQHQLSYALSTRDITAQPKSSATVRAHSGLNTKSSILHSFVNDTRDHITMPTSGKYFALTQELAGVAQRGDASFFKQELTAQMHQPLANGIVLSTGLKLGYLYPLEEGKDINVSDRFYVGGPLSVRGFKMGGIGARDGNDALGGNVFYAAGVSLTSPIPGATHLPIKAHAFFNAGNVINKPKNAPVNGTIEELINESRTAAGVGLVFHHELARIEANFCIPLRFQTGDLPRRGIQIGLGINFL